jgi:hypothetical protein
MAVNCGLYDPGTNCQFVLASAPELLTAPKEDLNGKQNRRDGAASEGLVYEHA